MTEKKACVIFTASKEAEAKHVVQRLSDSGYEISAIEVTHEIAEAAKAGDQASIPPEIASCLNDAEVCVILFEEETAASGALGGLAGIASDAGCRVVTIGGDPDELPSDVDAIIDGHVPSSETPDLIDVVNGRPRRIRPDNTQAPGRDPERVKCQ